MNILEVPYPFPLTATGWQSGPSQKKAAPLEGWLLGDPALPVQHVRRAGTVVVVDAAAAARLPGVAG